MKSYYINFYTLLQKHVFAIDAVYFKEQAALVLSDKSYVYVLHKNNTDAFHVMSMAEAPRASDTDDDPCLAGLQVLPGGTTKPKIYAVSAQGDVHLLEVELNSL